MNRDPIGTEVDPIENLCSGVVEEEVEGSNEGAKVEEGFEVRLLKVVLAEPNELKERKGKRMYSLYRRGTFLKL